MHLRARLLKLVLGSRLPHTRGTLHLPGVHAPLTIRRDAYGIPQVEAADEADAP